MIASLMVLHQLCHPDILILSVRVADTNGPDDDLDFETAVDQLLQPRRNSGHDPHLAFRAEAMALDYGFAFDQATDPHLKLATVLSDDPQLEVCALLCPDPSQRASFAALLQAEMVKCYQAACEFALQIAEQTYPIATNGRSLWAPLQPSQQAALHAPLEPIAQPAFQASFQPNAQASSQDGGQPSWREAWAFGRGPWRAGYFPCPPAANWPVLLSGCPTALRSAFHAALP